MFDRQEDYKARLYKLFAFAGRYAHQQWSDLLTMTTNQIMLLCKATSEIMEDERKGSEVD